MLNAFAILIFWTGGGDDFDSTTELENDASNWKSAAIQDQIGRGQNDPFTMAPRSNVNAAIQGRYNPNSPSSSSSNQPVSIQSDAGAM